MNHVIGGIVWVLAALQTVILSLATIVLAAFCVLRFPTLAPALGRVALLALASIPAAVLMPLFILFWDRLPARLAYWLNTPDDQDPAHQGWDGENHEPQVIWVHVHAGEGWGRVYWLIRNCLNGLAVALRPSRPDAATAQWTFDGAWVTSVSLAGTHRMRVSVTRIGSRFLCLYVGPWLGAYLNTINPPVFGGMEPDAARDTGGIPAIKVKLRAVSPL